MAAAPVQSVAVALVVAASLCGACSSAKMAGGKPIVPGDEPKGETLGAWRTENCRDRGGAPAIDPGARVKLLRTKERTLLLVDARTGYDTVVSENGVLDGAEWVYDVALKPAHGEPRLRQYRLPAEFPGAGRYVLASAFVDRVEGDAFRASVTSPAVECTLAPAGL